MAGVLAVWLAASLWTLDLYASYREAELRGRAAAIGAAAASVLSNGLNQRLALVRGLAAFVSVKAQKPADSFRREMTEEFAPFAEASINSISGLRNLSVAPDLVVSYVYPTDSGNLKVLGNHLLADPRPGFAEAVRLAVAQRGLAVHEPVDLIQGGRGLIARQAVFVDGRLWGAVGIVFELGPVLAASGLGDVSSFAWAVRTGKGNPVGGEQRVFDHAPIISPIEISGNTWELALAAHEGWQTSVHAEPGYRLTQGAFLLVGLLAALLTLGLTQRRWRLETLVRQRTGALERARQDLQQQTQGLAQANQELERFAYVAAHDLQEPLRLIICFSQLISRATGDRMGEEAAHWLAEVVEAAGRMRKLLQGVQLYLAETGMPPPDTLQDSAGAVEAACQHLAERIAQTGARVETGPLPRVRADFRRLAAILEILLENALEYRAPGRPPVIRITAWRDGPHAVITVADNGIGIAEEFHQRIFEVFQKLHRREDHPGTGMGLAIARKMVDRLGGKITLTSTPGQGSAFSIHLPLEESNLP